jgi:rhodanese-related sulfurtransferase
MPKEVHEERRSGEDLPDEFPPKDAADFIRSHPECVVIDVREPHEFAAGHLDGAQNLDYHRSTFSTDLGRFDPKKLYMLYCRRGIRAAQARKLMIEKGFSQVCCVQGGIDRWKAEGLPVKEGP